MVSVSSVWICQSLNALLVVCVKHFQVIKTSTAAVLSLPFFPRFLFQPIHRYGMLCMIWILFTSSKIKCYLLTPLKTFKPTSQWGVLNMKINKYNFIYIYFYTNEIKHECAASVGCEIRLIRTTNIDCHWIFNQCHIIWRIYFQAHQDHVFLVFVCVYK